MCYSAMVKADYLHYVRRHGAQVSMRDFLSLIERRRQDPRLALPRALEDAFLHGPDEAPLPAASDVTPEAALAMRREIRALILAHRAEQATHWEQALFEQRQRAADAQRRLARRPSKSAAEALRIAEAKGRRLREKLADLRRGEPRPEDARIYPGHFLPVLVEIGGRRVLRPMRFQCRPPGMPADFDRRYPGTYNARRDSLGGVWRPLFGRRHGVVAISAFFENVARHRAEGRELGPGEAPANVVLEFAPQPPQDLLVACLWSPWRGPDGETLLSFAMLTDEPPPEVAAAGHDRCLIPIRPERLDAWLRPDPQDLEAQQRLLDDRLPLFYAHRMAA